MVVVALLSATTLSGAEQTSSHTTAPHDPFDFIVGNWLVRDSSGRAIGSASVTKEYGGCVLVEKWRGVGKSREGLGVVGYQPATKTWHRDFIDDSGFVLAFDGQFDGAAMVMTGKDYQSDVTRMHRLTWTPKSDGSVEERWQTSTDAGQSWQEHFHGVFQRIAE